MFNAYREYWNNITTMNASATRAQYWWPQLINYLVLGIYSAITEEQLGDHRLEEFDLIITNQPIIETSVPSILINDAILFSNKRELLDLLNY